MTNVKDDEIPKEIRDEMKKQGIKIPKDFKPDALKKGDPFQAITDNLPQLMNQIMNREKRFKLILELTTPDLFKVSEFLMKAGIGKAQLMEDP